MTMVAVQKGYVVRTVSVPFHASPIDYRALTCLISLLGPRATISVNEFKTSQSRIIWMRGSTDTHDKKIAGKTNQGRCGGCI